MSNITHYLRWPGHAGESLPPEDVLVGVLADGVWPLPPAISMSGASRARPSALSTFYAYAPRCPARASAPIAPAPFPPAPPAQLLELLKLRGQIGPGGRAHAVIRGVRRPC